MVAEQELQTTEPTPTVSSIEVVFKDVLMFPWLPFRRTYSPEDYEKMGGRGSTKKVVVLVLTGACVIWLTLAYLTLVTGSRGEVDDLLYIPSFLSLVLLFVSSQLAQILTSFLSFRAFGGRGSLVSHGYCMMLCSFNVVLSFWVLLVLTLLLRVRLNFILGLFNLYLLLPLFWSWEVIHSRDRRPSVFAMALSLGIGFLYVPLYYLSLLVLQQSRPYLLTNLPLMAVLDGSTLVVLSIITLMWFSQQTMTDAGPLDLWATIKQVYQDRRGRIILVASGILLAVLLLLVGAILLTA